MDRNHDAISNIRKMQENLIKDMHTFIDKMSTSMKNFDEALIDLDERCLEIEYNISEMTKSAILSKNTKAAYINETYKLHEQFSFAGVNFECLKLYLGMKNCKFIYGITNKIIFKSSCGEIKVRPGHHIEDEWGDFVYLYVKVDNNENDFNIRFAYVDNALFWGLNFSGGNVCVVSDSSVSAAIERDTYIRLVYDSLKCEFVGVGCGDEISNINLTKCAIPCNFLKNWLLSPTSCIHVCNNDSRHYLLEIKGMVLTA